MTRFLLSVHSAGNGPSRQRTAEQMQEMMAAIGSLESELRSASALVLSARLSDAGDAKVVRATNGNVLSTDGPFVEAKEQFGGFYIIEADGLDAALDWAAKTSAAIGQPIEVRPFVDMASG